MLFICYKYLHPVLQKSILSIVLVLFFCLAAYAQNNLLKKDTATFHLNPLLRFSNNAPVKSNPLLTEFIKPGKHELMRWPNYPLNAVQIAASDREWDRKYNSPIGEQIASEIIKSYVNSLIYGRKIPPATLPKF